MRYLVKARLKPGCEKRLLQAIEEGSLGARSVAGDEYLHNMRQARLLCSEPLEEQRPYREEYFELLAIKDAQARRNCRHENGTELWACSDCDARAT